MKPPIALCALAFSLAACGQPEQTPTSAPASTPPPEATPPATATPAPTPPSAEKPFYVGRWAASRTECEGKAWTFTQTGLSAPDGTCDFTNTRAIATGFEADAQCRWAGVAQSARIQLAYAQSAQALLVSGAPGGDVGLIACES